MKKLNFGCGNKVLKGWDNWDIQKGKGILSLDLDQLPYPVDNNVYDYVLIKQVLYYLNKPSDVLKELWRVCKDGAIIEIEFPHYTNRGAYVDLDVKHYWDERAFINFVNQTYYIRRRLLFDIEDIKINYKYFKKTKITVFLRVIK